MAIIGAASVAPRKTAILPEGGRDFLRRRMMELVGTAVAGLGVVVLLALFTYSPGDPSLNHATGRAPHNTSACPAPTSPTCCCRPSGSPSSWCRWR